MRRFRLVGALVEVSPKLYPVETLNAKDGRRNLHRHSPAHEVSSHAGKLLGPNHLVDFRLRKHRAVVAVGSLRCQEVAAAGRFEVEVLTGIRGTLQKNLDAGIFPAAAVVAIDFGSETVRGLFHCKVDREIVRGKLRLGKHGRECDPLILGPVHIRFQEHVLIIVN